MAFASYREISGFLIGTSNQLPIVSSIALLFFVGAISFGFTRRQRIKLQEKAVPLRTEQLTWRLFITLEPEIDSYSLSPAALKAALEQKFKISLTGSKLVLARERRRYCATLSLKTAASPFIVGRKFSLEIDDGLTSNVTASITPDDRFMRMTTLYDGTAENANAVDLIVVPGLSSHAFGSFKSPLAADENWLRDYLPQTLPNIRVLVYGYDSRLLQYDGKESILDFAKGLLESIHSHRGEPTTRCRPVIFIGHSLGGLLIKEALAIAMDETIRTANDEQFFKACYGLIFFGVPNVGLRHEQLLATVIGKRPSERLVRDLIVDKESEPSPLLRTLAANFIRCCSAQDFEIVAFYETLPSRTVEQNTKGEWTSSGSRTLMVTEESATKIGGRSNFRHQIPLNTDHSGLVKFRGIHDPNYTDLVRQRIEEMAKTAPSVIDARLSRIHKLLPPQLRKLESLRHTPLDEVRHNKISDACPDTLHWILNDENFKLWQDSSEASLFWIHGSPGQGKSVLAKFITKHLEDRSETLPTERVAVISFFCYRQEDQPIDILRSLILQLIDCQELFEYLPEPYQHPSGFFDAPFSRLWELFEKLAINFRHHRVYCVIDALDECIQINNQRSDLLQRCVQLFSSKQHQLKLLVTSRPGETDILQHLDNAPKMSLRAQTNDLNIYIQSKIQHLPSYSFSEELKRKIQGTLQTQAGGTFLWASIIMKQVSELAAPSLYEVERFLEENPKELDKLYSKLVEPLTKKLVYAQILTWVAYAERPLTLNELTDAINYNPAIKPYKRLSEMEEHRRKISPELICKDLGTLLDIHRKDGSKSKGVEEDTNDYVFFNHYSMKEYFYQDGEKQLSSCGFINENGPATHLAQTCLYYLNAEDFNRLASETTAEFIALVQKARKAFKVSPSDMIAGIFEHECEKLSDRFHFLKYASLSWYKHIMNRQQAEQEWKMIEVLLDREQARLVLWIRGQWESGVYLFHEILFLEGEALGFEVSNLAIELDIRWLTELILEERLVTARFKEEDIVDMISRSPNSFQYLCVHRKDIKVPENVLITSVKSRNGKRGVQMLLEHRKSEFKINEVAIEAATAAGNDYESKELVELLLDQDDAKNIEITDKCFRNATKKFGGSRLMRFLLTRKTGEIDIVDELMNLAAGNFRGEEVMQVLLEYFGSRTKFSEELLATAVDNRTSMLELLFEYGKDKVKITEGLILAATKAYQADKTLRYLLERASKDVKITEDILIAASESHYYSPELITILIEERGEELIFAESVMQAILRGHKGGKVLKIVLSQYKAAVEITDRVLFSAISHIEAWIPMALEYDWEAIDVMELLLNQSHKKIQITEAIAEFAAQKLPRTQEMQSVMKMMPTMSRITETLLIAAAKNLRCSKAMLQLLFDRANGQVEITEDILKAVVENTTTGKEGLEWILQEQANKLSITERVLITVAFNPVQGEKMMALLLNQGDVEVNITEAVVDAAAKSWLESMVMSELFNQPEPEFQFLSTTLHCESDRGPIDFMQRKMICPEMNKTSLQIIKLLLNKIDSDYKIRERILLSSVGDKAMRLMLQLLDEELVVMDDDGSVRANITLMQERGITSKGLASCSSHPPWLWILRGYCIAMKEDVSGPQETLFLAASNEMTGHLIISELFGENVTWLQDKQLVEQMIRAAAASGQARILDYFFERCSIEESKRGDAIAISDFYNAVKQNDEQKVSKLLADGINPDIANFHGYTPLWQASVRNHTSILRCLLEARKVRINLSDRWKRTVLHWAAALNHSDIVKILLRHGADPEHVDHMGLTPLKVAQRWHAMKTERLLQNLEKGEELNEIGAQDGENKQYTALHFAALGGHERALKGLFNRGLDVNAQTMSLETPLHIAAGRGHNGIVKELLRAGADIDSQDEDKMTALHFATLYGRSEIIETLIRSRANIDAQGNSVGTALHIAAISGYKEVTKILLENGADVNAQEKGQLRTALHLAVLKNHDEVTRILLQKGADVNAQANNQMETALHLAACKGYERVMKTLLERGADVKARDFENFTALHFAVLGDHEEVTRVLLQEGADIEAQATKEKATALHMAATKGYERVMKTLLERGADVNAQDVENYTALHLAARHGHEGAVETLLKSGADVGAKTIYGDTLLHISAAKGQQNIAAAALKQGTNPSELNFQNLTALHCAARAGHVTILTLLLQHGIQIDYSNSEGYTALHLAAQNNHAEAVRYLVEQGADCNIPAKSGQTPITLAIIKGKTDVIKLLIDLHADISVVDKYGMTAKTWLKALKPNDAILSPLPSDSKSEESIDKSRLKQTIANLSANILEKYGDKPVTIPNELGHCFVMLGLTESASFAYQQRVTISRKTGIALHNRVICDRCSMSPIQGTRFVCEVCPDTDLCLWCMKAYCDGRLKLGFCDEHTFMEFSTFDPQAHDDDTVKDWLRKNIETYSEKDKLID